MDKVGPPASSEAWTHVGAHMFLADPSIFIGSELMNNFFSCSGHKKNPFTLFKLIQIKGFH